MYVFFFFRKSNVRACQGEMQNPMVTHGQAQLCSGLVDAGDPKLEPNKLAFE